MSLTQEELGDEVSWADDTPETFYVESSTGTAIDCVGELSIAATESLKLQQSVGFRTQ